MNFALMIPTTVFSENRVYPQLEEIDSINNYIAEKRFLEREKRSSLYLIT